MSTELGRKRIKMLQSFGLPLDRSLPVPGGNPTRAIAFMPLLSLISVCPQEIARDFERKAREDLMKKKQILVSCRTLIITQILK